MGEEDSLGDLRDGRDPSGRRAPERVSSRPHDLLERLFREERPRLIAALARLLGDLDLAEEAVQEAFARALARWPGEGTPERPRAWLAAAARNRAVDLLRRRRADRDRLAALERLAREPPWTGGGDEGDETIPDDRLRLIFTCCHPALSLEAQVALTLRALGGLTTREIARAFLLPEPTVAQRLVRAKRKIREARIPFRVPDRDELPERVSAVLAVLYLIFTEGYAATTADALVRPALCEEAIRLARLLATLLPDEPEVLGLLALMLLHDARREARTGPGGELVLLEEQDRSRWDRGKIAEGAALLDRALARRSPGPYQLQAAIAALHATAARPEETDWDQILALYDELARQWPSPVVALNRAVALAMARGPQAGLEAVDRLVAAGSLQGYHLLYAARADLLRRLGRFAEAAQAYGRALELAQNPVERAHLRRRLAEISPGGYFP